MKEIWKDIEGYKGLYLVSNLGNVKSCKREKTKVLSPASDGRGYLCVCLSNYKNPKTLKIHQLVAIAFLGHKRNGHKLVVDHINGVRHDNRLENLQIITHKENIRKGNSGKFCKNLKRTHIKVYWISDIKKWRSELYKGGKKINHLDFKTELKARLSYKLLIKNEKNETNIRS